MEWNSHWVARSDSRGTSCGEVADAVALFNAAHFVQELLASAGVELHEQGREWHTVNGCPLPGCTSTHDAFRVHIDRKPGDSRGPQWACRKCQRGGDALRLAMLLAGADPVERGATARFLREHGILADKSGRPFVVGNRKAVEPNNGLEMATKRQARTPHFAQERSGRVKATLNTIPRKESPTGDTYQQPVAKGQVPRVPATARWEGQSVLATGEGAGSAPASRGRGKLCPAPTGGQGARVVSAIAGRGEVVPADPLRWSRPDVLAVFGRHPTPDEIEALDERAGILEFDAGLPRQDAEAEALRQHAEGDNL